MRTAIVAAGCMTVLGLAPIAATPVVASAAAPAGRSATAAHTEIIADCAHPSYKPHKDVILYCGDATQALDQLHYDRWGTRTAAGRARLVYDDCQPNCAAGHEHHFAVTFVMKRTRTHAGSRLFTRLVTDHHGHRQTYDMPTSGPA